jgi:DNA-binding response OmpR family regulator
MRRLPSTPPPPRTSGSYIGVVEDGAIDRESSAATVLRDLGADVRTVGLRDDPRELVEDADDEHGIRPRAVVFESLERPELAVQSLRALRRVRTFDGVGSLLAVGAQHVTRIEPWSGFDDFVLYPYLPGELYARIRSLEWQKSEFETEERLKIGALVVDLVAHEVRVDGSAVALTAKEFGLLAYLCERRGRALSREQMLARVWGKGYAGGPRTVDIHVRRLRAKLGDALRLDTLRGWGYRLAAPDARELEISTNEEPDMSSADAN